MKHIKTRRIITKSIDCEDVIGEEVFYYDREGNVISHETVKDLEREPVENMDENEFEGEDGFTTEELDKPVTDDKGNVLSYLKGNTKEERLLVKIVSKGGLVLYEMFPGGNSWCYSYDGNGLIADCYDYVSHIHHERYESDGVKVTEISSYSTHNKTDAPNSLEGMDFYLAVVNGEMYTDGELYEKSISKERRLSSHLVQRETVRTCYDNGKKTEEFRHDETDSLDDSGKVLHTSFCDMENDKCISSGFRKYGQFGLVESKHRDSDYKTVMEQYVVYSEDGLETMRIISMDSLTSSNTILSISEYSFYD